MKLTMHPTEHITRCLSGTSVQDTMNPMMHAISPMANSTMLLLTNEFMARSAVIDRSSTHDFLVR